MADQTPTRRCGAVASGDGRMTWRVWAPRAKRVELVLIDNGRRTTLPMAAEDGGYFNHSAVDVRDGQRYAYRLDGGEERQDPCSLWQPKGVPGPSAVVKPHAFAWTDRAWKGVPREDLVIYELHVGTFTHEGTLEAVIPRLGALRGLGVTAIELMPVNQFPGARNWGYDGVLPYATQDSYGGPHGLVKLIDAAHAARLAVILDVVYNHLGPEANYLHEFGPYFTDKYKTPWARPSITTTGAATQSAIGCWTTCGCGSTSFTSTACGSTRSTRSMTWAPAGPSHYRVLRGGERGEERACSSRRSPNNTAARERGSATCANFCPTSASSSARTLPENSGSPKACRSAPPRFAACRHGRALAPAPIRLYGSELLRALDPPAEAG